MSHAKRFGQYFTPPEVARTLAKWAVRRPKDRLLDPACGNGEFLTFHLHSVGIELDGRRAAEARRRAQAALVHQADFFAWAERTQERFDAAVGNPPFIRYQGFAGEVRDRALRVAARIGAQLPGLTSSWAPFIAGVSWLLRPGGRLAFVVPAEVGHASYAMPLLRALCRNFELVRVIAIREKIFPELSEDTWLLYASGYGGQTRGIELAAIEKFEPSANPPEPSYIIPLPSWERAHGHLRRWLLPKRVLSLYEALESDGATFALGEIADVGIGYVTGANDFFHLRPSQARALGIPRDVLRPTVRRGQSLPSVPVLTRGHVRQWIMQDDPVLLLHLAGRDKIPERVARYLRSAEGKVASQAYKCRVRHPWFAVPDVKVPDGFLTYMSGEQVELVRNEARCVATNSVHVVTMRGRVSLAATQQVWHHPVVTLSSEIEGHSLGGGMLKVEPREAKRIRLPRDSVTMEPSALSAIQEGIALMRRWRHYA